MTTRVDPFEIVGTRVGAKYEVEEVVEQTAFSIVYRALHILWKRPVAIKAFKIEPTATAEARTALLASFIREGALLAELSERSTAICQARDVGSLTTVGGHWVPYMVLEWIDGEALDLILDRERRGGLPPRTIHAAMALLSPVAEALALAHARGIAHCDVKPGNVLVLRDAHDTDSHAKLLDFGVAQLLRGSARDGTVAASFTPGYAAPEQWSRAYGETGTRTDVFALALIVVELLTGREPLEGVDVAKLAARACDPMNRPTPGALGVEVGENVERSLSRALAIHPIDRFATARELWDDLRLAAELDALGCPSSGADDPVTISGVPMPTRKPVAAATFVVFACAALSWQAFSRPLGHAASLVAGSAVRAASLGFASDGGWFASNEPSPSGPLFATISVVAGALWLGTLFSVSWLCGRARMMADGPEIGRLSLSLFHRWTVPSLVVSLVAGATWCAGIGVEDQPTRWLCALVVVGLVPLGLSGAVGNAARRLARGRLESTKGEGARRFALIVSVWAATVLAIFRSSLAP